MSVKLEPVGLETATQYGDVDTNDTPGSAQCRFTGTTTEVMEHTSIVWYSTAGMGAVTDTFRKPVMFNVVPFCSDKATIDHRVRAARRRGTRRRC